MNNRENEIKEELEVISDIVTSVQAAMPETFQTVVLNAKWQINGTDYPSLELTGKGPKLVSGLTPNLVESVHKLSLLCKRRGCRGIKVTVSRPPASVPYEVSYDYGSEACQFYSIVWNSILYFGRTVKVWLRKNTN